MQLQKICELIHGQFLTSQVDQSQEILGGFSSDLMSDVLSSFEPHGILLTGLCNPQVVRTALLADIRAVIFVRGKIPPVETIQLAENENLPLLMSPLGMYEISGRLYSAGLPSQEPEF